MFPWPQPVHPLRCDAFIAAALHDPESGYYARRIRTVGRRGDFTTTAVISPALPAAIASWASRQLRRSGCRDLIELGPGDGTLAAGVLKSLPWWPRVRLHLVESSIPLREIQRQRLGTRVCWHADITSALAACKGRACIYSNEFFDAFPVRQFRRTNEGWAEAHILPDSIMWQPVHELPPSSIFERAWNPGQIVEVHESWHPWFTGLRNQWHAGAMLTIDYGARHEDLYPRQPAGSLRAYFHHQCLTGSEVFSRPGHQDITADVNFTDLARLLPGACHEITSQQEFLAPFHRKTSPGDLHAIDPSGAGNAFLVLSSELA